MLLYIPSKGLYSMSVIEEYENLNVIKNELDNYINKSEEIVKKNKNKIKQYRKNIFLSNMFEIIDTIGEVLLELKLHLDYIVLILDVFSVFISPIFLIGTIVDGVFSLPTMLLIIGEFIGANIAWFGIDIVAVGLGEIIDNISSSLEQKMEKENIDSEEIEKLLSTLKKLKEAKIKINEKIEEIKDNYNKAVTEKTESDNTPVKFDPNSYTDDITSAINEYQQLYYPCQMPATQSTMSLTKKNKETK
jgi:molecular chaperone GrpE (heat shock protein)